jgi:hypothetical protein
MDRKELIRKVLKENEDLDFLDTHWKKVNDIGTNISSNLPNTGNVVKKIGDKLGAVKFSDIDGTWNVKDLLGKSDALTALANKIRNMILRGRSDSIKRMVQSIANNNIKTLYKVPKSEDIRDGGQKRNSLGKGHFRWNDQAYTLTTKELQALKDFFGL